VAFILLFVTYYGLLLRRSSQRSTKMCVFHAASCL